MNSNQSPESNIKSVESDHDRTPDMESGRIRLQQLIESDHEECAALVDELIAIAVEQDATDVHLDPVGDEVRLTLRIRGMLYLLCSLDEETAALVTNRLKVMADLYIENRNMPQEGHIHGTDQSPWVQMRVSTYPTISGDCVSLRIFRERKTLQDINKLGLPRHALPPLFDALRAHDGLIVLAGPSGSGKTTTLYASLLHILKTGGRSHRVASVEDPIENTIPGVMQTEVNRDRGMTFGASLRAILRHDIEVIMVGEVRDAETAAIAVEAGLTGHLVLSTVHAGRSFTVPYRFLEMGVPPYALSGGLRLIVAQRLMRVYDEAERVPLTEEEMRQAMLSVQNQHNATASRFPESGGVQLLAEALVTDETLRAAILGKAPLKTFRSIAQQQGETLPHQALEAVRNGITSWSETCRVLAGDEGFESDTVDELDNSP